MEEAQLQLLYRIGEAKDEERELLLQQNAAVLPQLVETVQRHVEEQPALAPYLLPLAQELQDWLAQQNSNASSISKPPVMEVTANNRISSAVPKLPNLAENELHWATLSRSQPDFDESRIGAIEQTPQPMPRVLWLIVTGQKVRLINGSTTVEANFKLPPLSAVERVKELMKKAHLADPNEENELLELGRTLYQHLLPGAVGTAFEAIWNEGEPVQLHLELNDPAAQAVAWEYLANSNGFLGNEADFTLSRHVELGRKKPKEEKLALPLRLLVVVSSPLNLKPHEQLDADREVVLIKRGVKELVDAGDLEIEVEDIASLQQLRTTLESYKPHLVHFTGHGVVENDGQGNVIRSGLLLENAEGNKIVVTAPDLAKVFDNHPELRAIVLSACLTAVDGTQQAIESTATHLIKAGIPAVIAMQESILDDSATLFAQHFYPALAQGQPIGKALTKARIALYEQSKDAGKNSDWGMPVLLTGQPALNPFMFDRRNRPRPLAWQSGPGLSVLRGGQGYFVGRQTEQRKLREVLTGDTAKLAIVYGLGGFGKSTLVQRMIERTLPQFKLVHIISCKSWQGLDLAMSGLADAFASVGYSRLKNLLTDKERRFTPERYGQEVVKGLNELPALLVLDNFEDLLPWQDQQDAANAVLKPTDSTMIEWLETMLLALERGRILVTSRYNFVFTRTERHSQAIERIALDRLSVVEAMRLMSEFSELKVLTLEERSKLWEQGLDNPQIIEWADAQRRQDGGLERQIELLTLHGKFSSEMLLADLYAGLPERAKTLLRRMSVYREPLPIEFLHRQLSTADSVVPILEDRQLLKRVNSVSTRGALVNIYNQHQSVRLFGLERLKEEETEQGLIEAHQRAARHYEFFASYTSYSLSNYISAKDHYLAGHQIKAAVRLVRALNPMLERYGYWREGLELNRELNNIWQNSSTTSGVLTSFGLDLEDRGDLLKNEADRMRDLGDVEESIELYDQVLELAQQDQNRYGEGSTLGSLGTAYRRLGQYDKAIEYHLQALEIDKEINDRRGQGLAYSNLGNVYLNLEQYDKAIEYHLQALKIAEEVNDQQGLANAYGNLGIDYTALGQYDKAIEYHLQHLQIAEQIGDRHGEGGAYGDLGNVYLNLKQYDKAIEHYHKRLRIAQEIGYRHGQGVTYNNLGNIYLSLEQHDKAIEFYDMSLQIAVEVNDRKGKSVAYGNLGDVYSSLGRHERAIEFYDKNLQITIEMGDYKWQGITYKNLGVAYLRLKHYDKAIEYQLQALTIAQEIGDPKWQGNIYGNLGESYSGLGRHEQAIEFYQLALKTFEETDQENISQYCSNLGKAHLELKQYGRAIEFYEKSLQVTQEVSNPKWRGGVYGNLAIAYFNLGQYERANELYQKRLAIAIEIGDRTGQGTAYNNLSNIYQQMGHYEQAIEFLHKSLHIMLETNDLKGQVTAYGNLTKICFSLGQYERAVESGVQALLIYIQAQTYDAVMRLVFDLFRNIRLKIGQLRFKELLDLICHKLGVPFLQIWQMLEQNKVFSNFNTQEKILAYTFAHAALGGQQAIKVVENWLEEKRGNPDWARLVESIELLLSGERSIQVLVDKNNGLDEVKKIIMEVTLAAIADSSVLDSLQTDIIDEQSQGNSQSPQLNEQQRQIASALGLALRGETDARYFIENRVLPAYESEQSLYKVLASAIRRLLAKEDIETVLEDKLDAIDRVMLELAISVAIGISEPEAVSFPTSQTQLSHEEQMEQIIQLLIAAVQGDEQSQVIAQQIIQQLQSQVKSNPVGFLLERIIEEGERDRAKLTHNLNAQDRAFIEALLDAIEQAEGEQ
jgi:tetratricopeptide (TPR) repeat protein